MSEKANNFKIGLFIIGAALIFVGAIFLLSTWNFMAKQVHVESYFDESVEGLKTGAPFTFRGVEIGRVDQIGFVRDFYHMKPSDREYFEKGQYVFVRVHLTNPTRGEGKSMMEPEILEKMIDRGLRVQMKANGITGSVILQADYFDPETHPPMDITWDPKYIYIPSTPSFFDRIMDSVSSLMQQVRDAGIADAITQFNSFLAKSEQVMEEAQVGDVSKDFRDLMESARRTSGTIENLLQSPDVQKVPQDVASSVAAIERIVSQSEGRVEALVGNLEKTSAYTEEISRRISEALGPGGGEPGKGLEDLQGILSSLRKTSEDLPDTVRNVNETLLATRETIETQKDVLHEILMNFRVVSENLRVLSENLKMNPSQAILSEPPPRTEIERR